LQHPAVIREVGRVLNELEATAHRSASNPTPGPATPLPFQPGPGEDTMKQSPSPTSGNRHG
jgi:hypothetical protein